jgi:hypothetical protein
VAAAQRKRGQQASSGLGDEHLPVRSRLLVERREARESRDVVRVRGSN